ncbi:MAG: 3-dehydroquinate synthase [Aequorivita sp.]
MKELVHKNETAWHALNTLIQDMKPSKIFVLMDENTYKHCFPLFTKKIKNPLPLIPLIFPSGEEHKNIASCLQLWHQLSREGADRNSLLINLGGGVVTDLGGFVAATFKRGIAFVNIPTSLLAMVDAALGGKNGVDLGTLKNQIGTITDPEMVAVDTTFLDTLPHEHLISGFAEMLKHGLVYSRAYWDRLKTINFQDKSGFENLIWESIEIKNNIVVSDPFETGRRKILNFGHTLGHAMESYFLKDKEITLLHGEAIAIGLVLESFISNHIFGFSHANLKEVSTVVKKIFPKISFNEADIKAVIDLLIFDKKNRNGKVLFVLLEDFGKAHTDCVVGNELIINAFNYYEKL